MNLGRAITDQFTEPVDIEKVFTILSHTLGFFAFGYLVVHSTLDSSLPIGIQLVLAGLVSTLYLVFRMVLSALVQGKSKYHVVGPDKGGAVLIEHVLSARHSIRATHFTPETPSAGYLGTLVDKLKEGVRLHRLVYRSPQARPGAYDWLNALAPYQEYYCQSQTDVWLPYNVVVIDKRKVWMFFPMDKDDYYNRAVWLDDREVGELFAKAFDSFVAAHGRPDPLPSANPAPATTSAPALVEPTGSLT
jgi:hypothetical protein